MKNEIRHTLVAKISIAKFLHETKPYYDRYYPSGMDKSLKENLTDKGKQAIDQHVWNCYIPQSKMGKNSRNIDSKEVSTLLQSLKHIDNAHLISYYKSLSHIYLEETFITIVFFNYLNDKVTEELQNALFLKGITKKGSKSGSIDALVLEKSLESLMKKDEKISDFIGRKGKHPLISFLGINARTIKSFEGKKDAN